MISEEKIMLSKEYLQKAFNFQMKGSFEEAIINYKLSIKYNPTAEAHTYLAWVYGILGKFEKAIDECFSAIELDEKCGNAFYDVGNYLVQLDRDYEAVEWFYKAIKSTNYEPKHFPYYNLGKIFKKRGDWDKALTMFREALRHNPSYKPARKEYYKIIALSN